MKNYVWIGTLIVLIGGLLFFVVSSPEQIQEVEMEEKAGDDHIVEAIEKTDGKIDFDFFRNIEGQVELIRGEEVTLITESNEISLQRGDRIVTDETSNVSIYFHEETSIHLGEHTEITIDHWEQDGDKHIIQMNQHEGQIWYSVKPGDDLQINHSDQQFYVVGTHFLMYASLDGNETWLTVFSGIVSAKNNRVEEDVQLFPSTQITIDDNGDEISYIDLNELIDKIILEPNLIEAIIRNKNAIDEENRQYIESFRNALSQQKGDILLSGGDIDELQNNIDVVIGNLLKSFVEKGAITEERINELLLELKSPLRYKDYSQLTEFKMDSETLEKMEKINENRKQFRKENEEKLQHHQRETMDEIKRKREQLNEMESTQSEARETMAENRRRELERELELKRQQTTKGESERENKGATEEKPVPTPKQDEKEKPSPPRQDELEIVISPIANQTVGLGRSKTIELNVQPENAKMKARTNDFEKIAVATNNHKVIIEGLKEGKATVQIEVEQEGYATKELSFDVEVTAMNGLPIGKSIYLPSNKRLMFENGVIVDLNNTLTSADSKILVEEITPTPPVESSMNVIGPAVRISFEAVEIVSPVPVIIPTIMHRNLHSLFSSRENGVFYLNDEGKWEFIQSNIVNNGLAFFLRQSGNYGLFSALIAPHPQASVETGIVPMDAQLQLEVELTDAQIYYTTDGSEPTRESTLYKGPIVVNEDVTVKAMTVAPHFIDSSVVTYQYSIEEHYDVAFYISDGEQILEGATIKLAGIEKESNEDGIVQFSLPKGTYEYEIVADGYEKAVGEIHVTDQDVALEIMLEQKPLKTITMIVTDGHGVIENAVVQIDGKTGTTNSEGYVQFTLPFGTYEYTVERSSYVTKKDEIIIDEEADSFEVILELQYYDVSFSVYDDDGPILEAIVRSNYGEVRTDSNGFVQFELPPGFSEYVVEKSGYETVRGFINIMDQPFSIEIKLEIEETHD